MEDVTWFGGAYLALQFFGFLYALSQIGERRKPLTLGSVICGGVIQALVVWGVFAIGVTA